MTRAARSAADAPPVSALERTLRRLRRDRYLQYTALLAPVGVLAAAAEGALDDVGLALAVTPVFLAAQALLGLVPASRRGPFSPTAWSLLRLIVPLLYVAVLVTNVGGPTRPLLSLYLPVVVAAAALGTFQAITVGTIAALIYLAPFIGTDPAAGAFGARAMTHAGVAVVLAIATRQLLAALDHARHDLRAAVVAERRRARQIGAMEAVDRVLVAGGETGEVLSRALAVITDRFGYEHVSIYLWDGQQLRLGAQQNYDHAPEAIPAGHGVVGRVVQTREAIYLPDVAMSADYVAVQDGVVSEVCAPLLIEGALLGVLNVEGLRGLDRTDRDLIVTLADRVATVVALGRDRQALAERTALFRGLHEYAGAVSATLHLDLLAERLVDWTARMVPADLVVVSVLDRESGHYLMRAARGAAPQTIGKEIRVGEGVAGRAIRDRAIVVDEQYGPEAYPAAVRDVAVVDVRVVVALPLVRDGVVIGALTVGRADAEARFSRVELEALELLAGHATLALANAFLHAEVEAQAVRDPLTGLHNRRHFDDALDRLVAAHRRDRLGDPAPLSAIMFDLDHFGQFNKDHGHQVGDAVLRTFAGILRGRFRASDLVARFGGEEFVVVLDGSTLAGAEAAAEEVRAALDGATVPDESGKALRVTVSAGCAELDSSDPSREALLRTADVALFMAKRAGRNRVVAA